MSNGGKLSMDQNVCPVPIDCTGEELMGILTLMAATAAGGFLQSPGTPGEQLKRFMTAPARGKLPLSFKSIVQIMFEMVNAPVDPLWAHIAAMVGKNHETPAQQLFCVLCYFGRLKLEPTTELPLMIPYYKLLRCTTMELCVAIFLESELLDPIKAMMCE